MCSGQSDYPFLARERIDDQALKSWGNDLVILGQQKKSGRVNTFCIGKTIELAWDLQGDGPGNEPKIPPAVVA